MRARLLVLALLFTVCEASGLHAANCVPDLLSNYEALGVTGCQVGDFTVKSFTYNLIASSVTIADTDITVTPVFAADRFGLNFSSPKFNISGSDFARYLLGYTWDPHDIRSLEDILVSDPPVAPGTVTITTKACKNSAFPCAPPNTVTVQVFDFDTSENEFDAVVFSPPLSPGVLGIQNTIDLEANGASSQFTGFTNQVVVTPEPSTLMSGALLLVFAACSLRSRLKPR